MKKKKMSKNKRECLGRRAKLWKKIKCEQKHKQIVWSASPLSKSGVPWMTLRRQLIKQRASSSLKCFPVNKLQFIFSSFCIILFFVLKVCGVRRKQTFARHVVAVHYDLCYEKEEPLVVLSDRVHYGGVCFAVAVLEKGLHALVLGSSCVQKRLLVLVELRLLFYALLMRLGLCLGGFLA